MHPLSDKNYETLKMQAKGTFQKPKNDKIWKEKGITARFWRAKRRFKVRNEKLFFDEKDISLILVKF